MHFTFKNTELTITWRMWLIVIATGFSIYLSGTSTGYFIAQAQYSQRADKRDKTVGEIKLKVDQIPDQTATKTADKVKQVVQEDAPK
ncbi:Phage protein [Sodalis praecaptivus]|uniref:Phage protein n=2 Tax=Bruguierivoracaceae TaxID=2812006 RepID=W0HVP7_9GAMM|nr:Phage protein [Sodalis praecaptivus]